MVPRNLAPVGDDVSDACGKGEPMATPEYVPGPAVVEVRLTDFAGIPPPGVSHPGRSRC
jgi:hypothetical protein